MSRRSLIALAGLGLCAACGSEPEARNMSANEVAAELANVRIDPGLWESTSEVVEVTAPNLPREIQSRMKSAPQTIRHCISEEQASRPDANFLAMQNDQCSYRDFTMRGGRMQGRMTCKGGAMPGEANAVMDGQYGPDSYDMRMRMEMDGPADARMTIVTRASGRRVGECNGEEASK